MEDIKISFELDSTVVTDAVDFFTVSPALNGLTYKKKFNVYHNSNYSLNDCGFYISLPSGTYKGTKDIYADYQKVLWFGDNFQELDSSKSPYGFFIEQDYLISGIVENFDYTKIVDTKRSETKNIFINNDIDSFCTIKILTGSCSGEERKVLSFNPDTKEILISGGFNGLKNGDEYQIYTKTINLIKNKNGSSEDYLIPLLYNGGTIGRARSASFTLAARLPENLKEPGIHYFDLNFKYIPEE